MYTLTPTQAEALVEILTNLTQIDVPKETKVLLNRRQRLLKKLTDQKTTLSAKTRILQKHYRQVYDTLLSVKSKLTALLRCL